MSLRAGLLCGFLAAGAANGQIITTFAGSEYHFDGDGKRAIQAPLGRIVAVTVDTQGRVYVADPDNHMVMRFTPNGTLNVIAGNGIAGGSGDGGPATSASLSSPAGLALDPAGNLYITDLNNSVIRKVTPDGVISTVGGGRLAYVDGPAETALFHFTYNAAVACDSAGAVYIADYNNARIRKLSTDGQVTTIAGNGRTVFSGDGGPATSAALAGPAGIAVARNGDVYFSDSNNFRIRKISDGVISTVAGNGTPGFRDGAGTAASLAGPQGLAFDAAGNLYIADSRQIGDSRVRRLSTTGNLTTVAGTGPLGFSGDGGSATAASLNQPSAVAVDSAGNLYIADSGNGRVRRVNSFGAISTAAGNDGFGAAGDGGPAVNASFKQPVAVAVDNARNTYVVDKAAQRVRKIDPSGIVTTIAGTGEAGFSGDGGPSVNASLRAPNGIAADSSGNVYIADVGNQRIRKIAPDGTISTFAGGGASTADGVRATTASLNSPDYIAVDAAGSVYYTDYPSTVRKISSDGTVKTVAGGGRSMADGIPATTALLRTQALAVDSAGTVYVADYAASALRIRKVSSSGTITTVAGNASSEGCGGDGGPATAATLSHFIYGLAVDTAGNLYISDDGCSRVRRVSASGVISTFAGDGRTRLAGDGGPADAASVNPYGIALDPDGNIYIADAGNSRIRRVLTALPAFDTSPGTLTFSANSSGAAPPSQNLALTAAFAGPPFQVNLATTDGNAWLATNAFGGVLPTVLQVYADPTGLDPGSYQGTVTVGVAGGSPPQRTVQVVFNVGQTLPPRGSVDPASVSFSLAPGGAALTRQINVSNQGGGALPFTASAATNSGGAWLTISPASGTVIATSPASIAVTANPASLSPGTYTGAVVVSVGGANLTIPVTATVTAGRQSILVSQTGLTFTAVSGGGVVPGQTFGVLNLGQGQMSWTVRATTLSGGANWLQVSPGSGSTDAASLSVPLVEVGVNHTGLAPGNYYGQVQVSAGAADNTPQVVTVALNVLPAGSDPGPLIRPTGLIFVSAPGASPGSQNVQVSNLSASAISFISGRLSDPPGNLFQHQPAQASIAPNAPVNITVQPTLSGADSQVYRGTLTLQFSSGLAQTVSLLFVVAGGEPKGAARRPLAAGCLPSRLILLFTSLSSSFSAPAGWPTPIELRIVDDCGDRMVDGAVTATFSTGDPPLSLTSLKDGRWTGTWLPGNASESQAVVTVKARASGTGLSGTAQLSGGLAPGFNPPVIPSGGVVNAASRAQQAPLAPGTLITVSGASLADGPATAPGYPLPLQLGATSALIAGRQLPLLSVAPGSLTAQIPYDLPLNTVYQLVLQRGLAVATSPQEITIASAQPAIFTSDQSGGGQGSIYKVIAGRDSVLADSSNPLQPGDHIVIQCTGLGAVTPSISEGAAAPGSPPSTVNPVFLTIGGVNAQVDFAGLITGLAGIYQVQATVPAGVPSAGPAPFVITVAGQASNVVTAEIQ